MTTETQQITQQVNTDFVIRKEEMWDATMMDNILRDSRFAKRDLQNLSHYKKAKTSASKNVVMYEFGKGCAEGKIGRLYVKNGLGLQCFPREIRNPLLNKYYWDCDMENAHFFLLERLGNQWGVRTDAIQQYIGNREEELAKVSSNRAVAKTSFLKTAYGGNVKLYDEQCGDCAAPEGDLSLLTKVEREVSTIANLCWTKYPHLQKLAKEKAKKFGDKKNPTFSLFSLVLQTEERRCLEVMDEYLKSVGRQADIFIHDGCEIRKIEGESVFPADLLRGCEKYVFEKIGYTIKLVIKPFTHLYEPVGDKLIDVDVIIDDTFAAKKFRDHLGAHIVFDNGRVYVFNRETGIWSDEEGHISRVITGCEGVLVFKQMTPMGLRVTNYSGVVKNTKNLMIKLPDVLPIQNGWFSQRISSDIGKLLFPNGIYDFKTGIFTEGFDADIIFTAAMPRPFSKRNQALVNEIRRLSFEEPLDDENRNILLHTLMRGLIGDYQRKKFCVGTGFSNSGKGVLTTLLISAFGRGYVTTYNSNSLLAKRTDGESSRDLGWLLGIVGSRLAIGNEISMADGQKACIDGNLAKQISGGGDAQKCRRPYGQEVSVVNKATCFLLAQDIPEFSPVDDAIRERLIAVEWAYSYKADPKLPHERMMDPTLKTKYESEEYGDAMFWLIVEEYEKWRETGFAEPKLTQIQLESREAVAPMTDYAELLTEFEITGDQKDKVLFKEIKTALQSAGVKHGDTMMARCLKAMGLVPELRKVGGKSGRWYGGIKRR